MYNVDMPDRLVLPEAALVISILNSLVPSRFKPTDSLATLFSQLMIEEWNIQGDFNGYYEACTPDSCTYTQVQRLNIISIITTIVNLAGGLVITLRLFVQFSVKFVHLITTHSRN
ncbi:unnamed protein product [Rotaria socialis]|uniref:Uncharacterized protein n=1 Tax=Rotaria socialis TaxID=392032 RepID=A0A821TAI2_9BILA|nr:unnamed protein product [Rotaria socialis]CAF4386882.1 unnamed protein product [Rotaria socialis]CAF4469321.1 unnamed protein product [Rotaria socialis]CAF4683052.1 unnamed protein product [Rotaria socialis]CAF4869427.1 unnamed protein product [Rotaria socialis]